MWRLTSTGASGIYGCAANGTWETAENDWELGELFVLFGEEGRMEVEGGDNVGDDGIVSGVNFNWDPDDVGLDEGWDGCDEEGGRVIATFRREPADFAG